MSDYGKPTLDLLAEILKEGVDHVALLMRHSAREYNRDIPELDNMLIDEGRDLARAMGRALPKGLTLRGYHSPVQRCVETTELILEGHLSEGGKVTRSRRIEALGHFFILDWAKLGKAVQAAADFSDIYELWFSGRLDPDIMIPSALMAQITAHVAVEKLKRPVSKPQVDLLVSHDMNLYPLREHLLGQSIAEVGPVNYLDALAFYIKDGDLMIRSHHGGAKHITLSNL